MNGRREKRNLQEFRVLLSNGEEPVDRAYALTENVSANGMRAVTDQPRNLDTRVLVKLPTDEIWARVIYCQELTAYKFALGLELLAPRKNGF